MTTVQIHLEVNNNLEIELKTIKLLKGELFEFPNNQQQIQVHKELMQLSTIKNAMKNMTKRGQFRNIKVTLSTELKKIYMDEADNFRFNDEYLFEYAENKDQASNEITDTQYLYDTIARLENQLKIKENNEFNINKIHQSLMVEKYDGNKDGVAWMKTFEKECERNNILEDDKKIQLLRLFMLNDTMEWYSASLHTLTIDGEWSEWKKSFVESYSDKSWRTVHFAYTFRHIGGSFYEYAHKKDRLLLDTEPTMSMVSRINHIVCGLPYYIMDKLDKEEIKTVDELLGQLRRYSVNMNTNTTNKRNKSETTIDIKDIKKNIKQAERPCSFCASIGYPARYHPVEICRTKKNIVGKVNINTLVESEDVQDSKNE